MNKHIKRVVTACIALSLVTGCTSTQSDSSNTSVETSPNTSVEDTSASAKKTHSETDEKSTNDSTEDSNTNGSEDGADNDQSPDSDVSEDDDSRIEREFKAFMTSEPNAEAIADYMKLYISDASPKEADLMLSRLLIAQEELHSEWMDMIMDDRLTGFQEMGFEWNTDRIIAITDPDVKSSYEKLINSYARVKTYEETPSVETDWFRLKEFSRYLSEDTALLIEINDKIQRYTYGSYPANFSDMAKDVIKLENPIKQRESGFISYQMNKTYNRLIGEMFYSVEGMNMEYWGKQDSSLMTVLSETAISHPDSEFGKLCASFLKKEAELRGSDMYYNELGSLVSTHNQFGLQTSIKLDSVTHQMPKQTRRIDYIDAPENKDAARKINETIELEFGQLQKELGWSEDNQEHIDEFSFIGLCSPKYYGVTLYSSMNTADGNYSYAESYLMFDLETGEILDLQDIFGMSHNDYEPVLLELIHDRYMEEHTYFNDLNSIEPKQPYQLDEFGLSLYFDKGQISPDYEYAFTVYLPLSDLQAICDPMNLYK